MKHVFLIGLFLICSFCAMSQWTNLGLNAYQVNDLTLYGDTLYASTENGIYKKHKATLDSSWIACGMQGRNVAQTLVENHQTFYSPVTIEGTYTNQLYQSVDGGASFGLMTETVSNMNEYQYLDLLAHPPGDFSTMYSVNHQLKTDDGGATWEPLNNFHNTDRFIMVNPTNTAQIMIGGEGDLFNPLVQVSNDYGQTWNFPAMNGFFAGDNALHDIAIDGPTWYAAGEGVICKSEDEGENWVQLLNVFDDQSIYTLYYTNIEFSPVNSDILYVSGLNNTNANEVPLLHSNDRGATWDSIYYESPPATQRVQCLTVDHIDNTDWVYLGGKGVFVYQRLVMGVANGPVPLDFSLYPNPTPAHRFGVTYASKSGEEVTARIYDLRGRLIKRQAIPAGQQTHSIDISGLRRGTYVLQLEDGDQAGSKEFVVQ